MSRYGKFTFKFINIFTGLATKPKFCAFTANSARVFVELLVTKNILFPIFRK